MHQIIFKENSRRCSVEFTSKRVGKYTLEFTRSNRLELLLQNIETLIHSFRQDNIYHIITEYNLESKVKYSTIKIFSSSPKSQIGKIKFWDIDLNDQNIGNVMKSYKENFRLCISELLELLSQYK